jgi:hypothetical protein
MQIGLTDTHRLHPLCIGFSPSVQLNRTHKTNCAKRVSLQMRLRNAPRETHTMGRVESGRLPCGVASAARELDHRRIVHYIPRRPSHKLGAH